MTGCDHDLIYQDVLRGFNHLVFDVDKPITFKYANGTVPAVKQKARLGVSELGDVAQAWVLNGLPAVLSLGKRCVEGGGYDFVW